MLGEHSTMTQSDAYDYGKDVGYSIGTDNVSSYAKQDYDEFMSDCLETESEHYRQFSPFEFYAREFNAETHAVYPKHWQNIDEPRITKQDPDKMWTKYEQGVRVGLVTAWREFHS